MSWQAFAAVVIGTNTCVFGIGFAVGYRYWLDFVHGTPGRHRITEEEEVWEPSTAASPISTGPGKDESGTGSLGWLRERLATTGELRALAEAGQVERLHAETTAFHAITELERWTR